MLVRRGEMGNYYAPGWSMTTSGGFLSMSTQESTALKSKENWKGNEKKEINIGNVG